MAATSKVVNPKGFMGSNPILSSKQTDFGGLAEWPKAENLKFSDPYGSVGSNPTSSANYYFFEFRGLAERSKATPC